ncbi:MAG: molybdenum cofactor biosynthesis protein MoaE [Acidobacteriaceae bacterium]|nr:molybdenum cofactor biosynthesis protein MoaE [Acidobacteriaceae bacterium]MBV9781161.1 molybdenum cofactor biosynthesis protein MoaE [Acidobacteriaceae bacterium]
MDSTESFPAGTILGMRVRILFFGILKDIVGRSEELVNVEPDSTIGSLFDAYSAEFETLRDKRPSLLFARNREFVKPDVKLADNDEIAFLPPVSGGIGEAICPPEGHIFAITRKPIDSQALARRVQRPEDGAVVIFEGVVRNNTNGRQTTYLEYECYEQMALEQMKRIGLEVATQFPIGCLGMIHRMGKLQIGEASVAVIATAPHRRSAFEAALEGINRLKREVPIWKKEFFADGALWVEGEWDEKLIQDSTGHGAP